MVPHTLSVTVGIMEDELKRLHEQNIEFLKNDNNRNWKKHVEDIVACQLKAGII
jgi:hypothetical protein